MANIEILVVLYNKNFKNSETLQTLLANQLLLNSKHKITIWDNSPKSLLKSEIQEIKTVFSPCEVEYVSTTNNVKLSCIYNIIRKKTTRDFLILLDHDTCLPSNYIDIICNAIDDKQNFDINLFLPILYSNNSIISPAYVYRFSTRMWQEPLLGRIKSNSIQAINSSMIIRSSYFKDEFKGYNEELEFYGTDNFFMKKFRESNSFVYILPLKITHHSNFREDNLLSRATRFMAIKKAAIINAKEEGYCYLFFEKFRMLYIAIKYCVSNRSLLFLKGYFNLL